MVNIGLFYKAFYKIIKEKLWRTIGIRLYHKRNLFILNSCKKIIEMLKISNDSKYYLLDIGCGTGYLTAKISEALHFKAIGIDLNIVPTSHSVEFLVADACYLPFKPNSFILVTAFSLIEHIPKGLRQKLFHEVHQVLKVGGFFIIQLPNRYFPLEQHTFLPLIGYLPSSLHSAFYYEYLSIPSIDDVVNQLSKNFKIIRIINYGVPFSSFFERVYKFPFGFLIIGKRIK
ncbi:MAG: class I SAM-dependent methyltransferase [Nitrososphaeria archaeon]